MAIFRGFKPEGLNKIAKSMGYQGSMDNFAKFIEDDPERQEQAVKMENAAKAMARGGVVNMLKGGDIRNGMEYVEEVTPDGRSVGFFRNPNLRNPMQEFEKNPIQTPGVDMTPKDLLDPRVKLPEQDFNPRPSLQQGIDIGASRPTAVLNRPIKDQAVYAQPIPEIDYIRPRVPPPKFVDPRTRTTTGKVTQAAVPTTDKQGTFADVTKEVPSYELKGTGFKFGSEKEFENFKKLNPKYAETKFSDLLQKTVTKTVSPDITDISASMLQKPGLPTGAVTKAAQITEKDDQIISDTIGQLDPRVDASAGLATTTMATVEGEKQANKITAAQTLKLK